MGIIRPGDPLMLDPDWRPEERICFYCGNSVWEGGHLFVFWFSPFHGHIVLHGQCSQILGERLIADGKLAGPLVAPVA